MAKKTNKTKKPVIRWRPEVTRAIDARVAAIKAGEPEPKLLGFDEQELTHILQQTEIRVKRQVDERFLLQAMKHTRPLAVLPRVRGHLDQLTMIFAVPTMLAWWASWTGVAGKRGGRAGFGCARAVLALTALGCSTHVFRSHERLEQSDTLQQFFAGLEQASAQHSNEPRGPFRLIAYKTVCHHFYRLVFPLFVGNFAHAAMRHNVAMIKQLRAELGPQVGKRFAIDGSAIPAWVQQVGKRSPEQEAVIRKNHPEAAARSYVYTSNGKEDVSSGARVGASLVRFWRGYTVLPLVELATGRAVVWLVLAANINEHDAVSQLLDLLFELWPDCPIEVLVADSEYDVDETYGECERRGIHLVAVRKPQHLRQTKKLEPKESKAIATIDGLGIATCRRHEKKLRLAGYQLANRDGLKPGEPAKQGEFRVRFDCDHDAPGAPPCGRLSLPMHLAWARLAYYPHHGTGSASARYAERVALQGRRNACEQLFSSLKVSQRLGHKGGDRCRLRKPAVDALISIAFLFKTALMLADVRRRAANAAPAPTASPVPPTP